jgi:hypothetical protein
LISDPPQTFRLHIMEEGTTRIISDDIWRWQMAPGASISCNGKLWRVLRIVPHPVLVRVDIVWVELQK